MAAVTATRMVVAGRVQGVGFRYALADEAAALGLTGWVRNRSDGTVEACVQGPAAAVQRLVAWARKGPPAARASGVSVSDMDAPSPLLASFVIWPTA